ncbi:lipoprotein signal peptidase [Flavobacterium sp.]|uniref:lipoprotein signal peptidase n=1 Tax=Flavobacterium sp. TaxID=239 RepID=UPI0037503E7E
MKLTNSILLIFIILLIDQASKVFVKTNFYYGDELKVMGLDWFRIHFIENPGMAWGTIIPGAYGKLILTIFRILVVPFIGYWLYDTIEREKSNYLIAAIALIFAGALGNIIDSVLYGVMFNDSHNKLATFFPEDHYGTLFHGKVVDMFYFPIIEDYLLPNWVPIWGGKEVTFFNAIFNVADFSISCGVGILIFFNKRAFTLPQKSISRVRFYKTLD